MIPIALASDHAGYELKQYVKQWLTSHGYAYHDFGTLTPDRCDYADYGHPLAIAVEQGSYPLGIAICGSGQGIAMTVNKHPGIRAGLCWNTEMAHLTRAHNDANILCLPGRFLTDEQTDAILNEFFTTPFEGGRHTTRIAKIPLASPVPPPKREA